jgi:phosphoserine phosphatase
MDVKRAQRTLLDADAVCFDVDSTVITHEGIDVLASYLNLGAEVHTLTASAMGGGASFQETLASRLDLLKPSKFEVTECMERSPFVLTSGVQEVISCLHARGKDVFLVSGGFRVMIDPIAERLNIPLDRVFANNILFNALGLYAGYDHSEMTSRDHGKSAVLQSLIDHHGYTNIVMIGDGATDLDAKRTASAFIGYGGVVCRDVVLRNADWFVYSFEEVLTVLGE